MQKHISKSLQELAFKSLTNKARQLEFFKQKQFPHQVTCSAPTMCPPQELGNSLQLCVRGACRQAEPQLPAEALVSQVRPRAQEPASGSAEGPQGPEKHRPRPGTSSLCCAYTHCPKPLGQGRA